MGVIIPGDFKVVHIKRDFALNVFVLTRFHCTHIAKTVCNNLGNWMISGSPVSQQALCWAVHSPPDHIHTQCSWREGEV